MSDVVIRRLFPAFRYAVIDYTLLSVPGIGTCATNGRIFWGREQAEQWARAYCRRYNLPEPQRENYEVGVK